MSHYFKLLIAYGLSAILSITLLLTQFPVVTYATEDHTNQKAVAHDSTWGDYGFSYLLHRKYWTIQDTTGITPSLITYPDFYYTSDQVTFFKLTGKEAFTLVMNKGLGLVLDPDNLTSLYNAFLNLIRLGDLTNGSYAQGGVYDGSGNFLGYALNDITGCYYDPTQSTTVTIPKDFTNDIYYFYNYQTDANLPDFFTYYPPSDSYYSSHIATNNSDYRRRILGLTSRLGSYIRAELQYDASTNRYTTFSSYVGYYSITDYYHLIRQESSTNTNWRNFCNQYHLTINNNSLYFEDMLQYKGANRIAAIVYDNYNSSDVVVTNYSGVSITADDYPIANDNLNQTFLGGCPISTPLGDPITIYKSKAVMDGLKDKTYYPPAYISNKYITYNPVNDNSFTVNTTTIDNSTTTNETIYEDCNNDYYEYVDNTTVDNSEIINNNTTIINNYYPTVDDDPVGPDDPDEPGGGGGSDDDDPDIDNETILDAILDALGRFFKAIGKILATILAGLLEVVDSVLEAIAGIMENFTGITDFLQALFSWLPSPIPEVIAAGVSICILFAVFRFIRG